MGKLVRECGFRGSGGVGFCNTASEDGAVIQAVPCHQVHPLWVCLLQLTKAIKCRLFSHAPGIKKTRLTVLGVPDQQLRLSKGQEEGSTWDRTNTTLRQPEALRGDGNRADGAQTLRTAQGQANRMPEETRAKESPRELLHCYTLPDPAKKSGISLRQKVTKKPCSADSACVTVGLAVSLHGGTQNNNGITLLGLHGHSVRQSIQSVSWLSRGRCQAVGFSSPPPPSSSLPIMCTCGMQQVELN